MTRKPLVEDLLSWFARNARPLPWRNTRDPYAIWVSEIMLQQTQVKTVQPYWERWMRALPTVEALAESKSEKLHKLWEGLGYYKRVGNLQKAANAIRAKHGGRFPERFEDVLDLPGIGRYTAGAICSIAYNQPRPILDGNVVRVLARLFGVAEDPRAAAGRTKLWQLAEELVLEAAQIRPPASHLMTIVGGTSSGTCSSFNQSLMELGALVCTPKEPRCEICPVGTQCLARRDGRVADLPRRTARLEVTQRRFVAFLAQSGSRFFVRQRPDGVVNAHLWEFPNVEMEVGNSDLVRAAQEALGVRKAMLVPLGTIRHSITRYRIALDVCRVVHTGTAFNGAKSGRLVTSRQLALLPLSSAHKKILERYLPGRYEPHAPPIASDNSSMLSSRNLM